MGAKMLHTCIRVANLEKSLEFYKDVLGLIETRRKDFPEHKFTLVYLSDKEDDQTYEIIRNIEVLLRKIKNPVKK